MRPPPAKKIGKKESKAIKAMKESTDFNDMINKDWAADAPITSSIGVEDDSNTDGDGDGGADSDKKKSKGKSASQKDKGKDEDTDEDKDKGKKKKKASVSSGD
jgi:hypothetical protein